jgi:ammonia channel protein AmtB
MNAVGAHAMFHAHLLVSLQWILFGYSMAFGVRTSGGDRNWDWIGAAKLGLGAFAGYSATIPTPGVHDLSDDVRRDHTGAEILALSPSA